MARRVKRASKRKKKPKRSKKKKLDLGLVPTHAPAVGAIAPPALPLRHDHYNEPETTAYHPEVRLVIKTRYMEQKPHVLLIESVLLSTIIIMFFGLLFIMLHINTSILLPVLFAVWPGLAVLLYKFFED